MGKTRHELFKQFIIPYSYVLPTFEAENDKTRTL
jgi:hypothetical protein